MSVPTTALTMFLRKRLAVISKYQVVGEVCIHRAAVTWRQMVVLLSPPPCRTPHLVFVMQKIPLSRPRSFSFEIQDSLSAVNNGAQTDLSAYVYNGMCEMAEKRHASLGLPPYFVYGDVAGRMRFRRYTSWSGSIGILSVSGLRRCVGHVRRYRSFLLPPTSISFLRRMERGAATPAALNWHWVESANRGSWCRRKPEEYEISHLFIFEFFCFCYEL